MALLPSLVRFCANRIALLTRTKGKTMGVASPCLPGHAAHICRAEDRGLSIHGPPRTEPGVALVKPTLPLEATALP
jgi:hypothetical protein